MSTELAQQEIKRFLESDVPEVLCIKGKWGVGKTFTWNKLLMEASRAKKGIALNHYAYVSLFGLTSLDDLKFSVVEKTVPKSHVEKGASPESFAARIETIKSKAKSYVHLFKGSSGDKYLSILKQLSFLSVSEQIVCIDDLERRSRQLSIQDIFGLISFLKDERKCKVVLLTNDDALDDEAKKEFDKNLEKVVDVSLFFNPSPSEAAAIAIPGDWDTGGLLCERCNSLGITNIRIIKKIERVVREVERILVEFSPSILKQAVSSLTLFGWSHYDKNTSSTSPPTIEFLRARSILRQEPSKQEPREGAWMALLDNYDFHWKGEFDQLLLDAIRNGYFDERRLRDVAITMQQEETRSASKEEFYDVWRLYHDSFEDNETEFLGKLVETCKKHIEHLSHSDINGSVGFLREFEQDVSASELIQLYVNTRRQNIEFFRIRGIDAPYLTDPKLIQAIQNKYEELSGKPDVQKLFLKLKDDRSKETVEALAAATVNQYLEVLKGHTGSTLRQIVEAMLQFEAVVNATDAMREVSRKAKEALKIVGKESRINKMRVKRYGISIDAASPS
ncbi:MAG: hypothetical protein HZA67_09275 [Rhodospirillales bacterium]|nr:hypothetical protein [Rhodospirillales bacterium]